MNNPSDGYLVRSNIRIAFYGGCLAMLLALVVDVPVPFWVIALWFLAIAACLVWGQIDLMNELERQRKEKGRRPWL